MNLSRRQFAKGALCTPLCVAAFTTFVTGSARAAGEAGAGKPRFKPIGVDRAKVLTIYCDRTKPDLAPVLMMWEALTGVAIDLTVLTNAVAMDRIVAERNDPQADLVITNSTVEPESVRATGVFDPYPARVAKEIPDWLRAPDYSWMAFTAWPRAAMINWATLGRDPGKWPKRFEDLAAPEFHNQVVIASIQERTVTNYVTALRIAKGDEWTGQTLDRILDNGLRIYRIHQQTREALVREGYGVALVNSSNTHVFFLEGHPVGEAWLDQEAGGIGTNVDAHTIAVLRGGRQPEKARQFIDFLLSQEIQEFLARLYGETPVNPAAATGWVRPVSSLRRIPVEGREMVARFKDTQEFLRKKGFDLSDMDDPLVSSGRGGRRRDAERTVAMPGSS